MWTRFNKGFTIPEMLVTLVLTVLFCSVAVGTLTNYYVWHARQSARLELEENLQIAMERITDDARICEKVLSYGENALTISGKKTIAYTVSEDPQAGLHALALEGNVLYRLESGMVMRQPVANFLNAMEVNAFSSDNPEGSTVLDIALIGESEGILLQNRQLVRLSSGLYL